MSRKQLAKLMSSLHLRGISDGRQGRAAHLSVDVIQTLDLVRRLGALGVPAAAAGRIAHQLQSGPVGRWLVAPWLVFTYDAALHSEETAHRLRAAAERVLTPRRGRPPTAR